MSTNMNKNNKYRLNRDYVRESIKSSSMTLSKVSNELGFNVAYLNNILSRDSYMPKSVILQLASILNVSDWTKFIVLDEDEPEDEFAVVNESSGVDESSVVEQLKIMNAKLDDFNENMKYLGVAMMLLYETYKKAWIDKE